MAASYILCAAGEGTRFQKHFDSTPKALIKLYGVTLLEWSLRSLPIHAQDKLILITQAKHRIKEKMLERIRTTYPFVEVQWIKIDYLTRGQLETASLAFEHVLPQSSVVIYNCDTYFESKTLLQWMNTPDIEGIIPCAEAQGSSWSFCREDEKTGLVVEVKEKERISSLASVGLYYFKNSQLFFEVAQKALARGETQKGEYYVAPLYQGYIDAGYKVVVDHVTLFKPMGTPEQLQEFWQVDVKKLALQNMAPVLVMDLDNTITIDEPGVAYADKRPNAEVIGKMQEFADAGWEIIIQTSRRMETFGSDEARLIANVGAATLEWLKKHQVPFNGLRFGKPYARHGFYVDDKAMQPDEFLSLNPMQAISAKGK